MVRSLGLFMLRTKTKVQDYKTFWVTLFSPCMLLGRTLRSWIASDMTDMRLFDTVRWCGLWCYEYTQEYLLLSIPI